jgi:DNA-directed RNA polymerase specialized sigma24 family protein
LNLAERCLEQDAAALKELQVRCRARTVRFLRNAGVPKANAAEVSAELFTDLVTPAPDGVPLLATYLGQCALETWLNRAALSRAIDKRRSEERHRRRLAVAASVGHIGAVEGDQQPLLPETLLRQILHEAIRQALQGRPNDEYVMIYLLFGSNLRPTEVAKMFRCDWRTLRDRAEAACAEVRFAVEAELHQRDPWLNLSWSEIVNLLLPDLPHGLEGT